jgi:uncharacterized membrane protein
MHAAPAVQGGRSQAVRILRENAVMESQRRELDRVGAFSDGVFAIAITLLVLNIDVPDVPSDELGDALLDLSGDLVTYGIGFGVMGLFWFAHHRLFSRLSRSNGRLITVNMALLAFIALMPFTTGVLGRYDEAVAVTLYATNVGIAMILDGLVEVVAIRDELFEEPHPRSAGDAMRSAIRQALVFFVSIPIAYEISQSLAKWFWLALIPLAVSERRQQKDAKAAA